MPDTSAQSHAADRDAVYFTPAQVAEHNVATDCWLSWLNNVYDLSDLTKQHQDDPLALPLLRNAGKDISHWFNPKTKDFKTHVHPVRGTTEHYCPEGRVLHMAAASPDASAAVQEHLPWWQDDARRIGHLSTKTRRIKVVNTLTGQEYILEVASEETIEAIQIRYLREHNSHAKGYLWKRLGQALDMSKSLAENNIPDETERFQNVGDDEEAWLPVVHLYFSDDLTVQ